MTEIQSESVSMPLYAPAVGSGFAVRLQTETKLPSSPRAAVLTESKFSHAHMCLSLISVAMGDLEPKSMVYSSLNCHPQSCICEGINLFGQGKKHLPSGPGQSDPFPFADLHG